MAKKLLLSFLKGILAGLAIGLGGLFYILSVHYIPGEWGKIVGAILFPIGLTIVCVCALHLYTGKIGLVFEKKQTKEFYLSLPLMLLGNAVGAIALGYLLMFILKDAPITDTIKTIAESRTNLNTVNDYLSLIVKSFLCGIFVYLAVRSFAFSKNKVIGILLLFVFIFAFVYLSCQHCIANMFYLAINNSYADYHAYINLGICILMNSFGPLPAVLLLKLFKNDF